MEYINNQYGADIDAASSKRKIEKLGLFNDEPAEEIDMTEQSRITAEIDRQIAEKGITLVCDHNKMIPLNPSKTKG